MPSSPLGPTIPRRTAPTTPAAAKAALMNFSRAHDARSARSRLGVGTLIFASTFAAIGGVAFARILTSRKPSRTPGRGGSTLGVRMVSWAVAARFGKWLWPRAIQVLKGP